jgi:hypothetical protein
MQHYFFVFSYGDPSAAHVVRGDNKHTLEIVRCLVKSGSQVRKLFYLSKVIEGTHFERNKSQPPSEDELLLQQFLQDEHEIAAAEARMTGGGQ